MAPAQSFETVEMTIRRYPFATRLDRKCSEIRVRHEVAPDAVVDAQSSEDPPVPGSRLDGHCVGPTADLFGEGDGLVDGAG